MKIFLLGIIISVSSIFPQKKDWITHSKSLFEHVDTKHFTIYYYPESYAARDIGKIKLNREAACSKLSKFFNMELNQKVSLFFFPNEKAKYEVTGYRGPGEGQGHNIMEVLNDSVEVDPYHELAHIFIYQISKPPALFDEGLAVYLSEKFGDNGLLRILGYPGKTTNEVLKIFLKKNNFLDMDSLYVLHDLSDSKNVIMTYLQSASFVKYLVEKYGKGKILKLISAYSEDKKNYDPTVFYKVYYNTRLDEMVKSWKDAFDL